MSQQLEHALAFFTPAPDGWFEQGKRKIEAAGQWIWETLQGDFNDNPSTAQVVTGTVISMVPLVDQVCDIRDLIANCKKIDEDSDNTGAWVALVLTLIGCFPVLGSLVKGAFKVMFLYLRKSVLANVNPHAVSAVFDGVITRLNQFLSLPATRKMLSALNIPNPYLYLSTKLREVMGQLNVPALLSVFDTLLSTTRELLSKAIAWGPDSIKQPIQQLLQILFTVRNRANGMLEKVLSPVNDWLERLAVRLEIEGNSLYRAHTGPNVHKLNDVQEADLLLAKRPDWVDVNVVAKYPKLEKLSSLHREKIVEGWPELESGFLTGKYETFHSMNEAYAEPGERLYRILDPSNNSYDNGAFWLREKDFKALLSKAEWRKRCAVWKSWNENGEYAVYIVPSDQRIKLWEGPAATQELSVKIRDPKTGELIKGKDKVSLEGGGNQLLISPADLRPEALSPRRKTGWGYRDLEDEADSFVGVPQLKTNWYDGN